jgi:hypothetical protein
VILDVGLPDIRRPADFRKTRKCSAPSPRYQQGPLITRGARCLPRGGGDLPSARNSRCSTPWATTCVLFLNSAIVAGCRDGRRPAGEIVPQLPCKRDGAIAHHARLPVGTLPPESLTPRCDPLLPGAGAKAAAPCRLHVCCFAPTRRSEPKD